MSTETQDDPFYAANAQGIWSPRVPVVHRDDEYDPAGFDVLMQMQARHFWYLGRHRFLLHSLRRHLRLAPAASGGRAMIDLGGGVGGWIVYLHQHLPGAFAEWALADSSPQALEMAATVLPAGVRRYQIDLLNLGWRQRWDVAFLLDVLEHIPPDREALRQIAESLRPGGLLFVTTPALPAFWSYNDVLAGHQRRYTRADFARLAGEAGLELCDARYIMFLLSPLYFLSRMRKIDVARMSPAEAHALMARSHRVPSWPVNQLCRLVFAAETPAGHWCHWPWGTSILGVFRKPAAGS